MRGAGPALVRSLIPHLGAISATERIRASIGALVGILATGLVSRAALGATDALPLLIAPMGASAVLLFAVPSSPLAQPWSILCGNTVAALIGITCGRFIADPVLAAALACAAAIAAMLLLRCLHPPSGAVALTAVLGGPAVHAAGYTFALWPVGLNSLVLLLAALLFNNATGRRYPHQAGSTARHDPAGRLPAQRVGFSTADLAAVLRGRDEIIDIDPRDLAMLLHAAESQAYRRRFGAITCADIMTTGTVTVDRDLSLDEARHIMLVRGLDAMMVVGAGERLAGLVTAGDFFRRGRWAGDATRSSSPRPRWMQRSMRFDLEPKVVGDIMTPAVHTVAPAMPIAELVPAMAAMNMTLVPVVAPNERVIGVVTQADLIAALFRGSGAESTAHPAATT